MEAAVVTAVIRTVLPKLFTIIKGKYDQRGDIVEDIKAIASNLELIKGDIEDHSRRKQVGPIQGKWIQEVRKLAHDIEDCIERFMYSRDVNILLRQRSSNFAKKIAKLKRRTDELFSRKEKLLIGNMPEPPSPEAPRPSDWNTPDVDLMGIEEPLEEVLELMRGARRPQRTGPKVLSIVGFGGLGKTVLARKVYNSDFGRKFNERIWICATNVSATDDLSKILKRSDRSNVDVEQCLQNKRYLIVIDDVRTEGLWSNIEGSFPADESSAIIVTTAIQSVARDCSSRNGYVYNMKPLKKELSRRLFLHTVTPDSPSDNLLRGSEEIVDKCEGLPLALVCTGQYLRNNNKNTSDACADLCSNLGFILDVQKALVGMKRVVEHNYTSLPDHFPKECLLYLSMFPRNHPIKREILMRRWSSEEFVEAKGRSRAQDVAAGNFSMLIDRHIIQPVDVSNNAEVKACKPQGMMLEFILHKSICQEFTTFPCYENLPETVRRLCLHDGFDTDVRKILDKDLSYVRSLTVSGEAHEDILDFEKYKLLRVLDLEECHNLEDRHIEKITKLFLLRYLSLSGGITKLPDGIAKLKLLETLDMRRSDVIVLSEEILGLPGLLHLFGKFKLADKVGSNKKLLDKLVKVCEKSNLQTLSGFVTDNCHVFPQLICHMENIRKVKIWCEPTADGDSSKKKENTADGYNSVALSEAIQKFIKTSVKNPVGKGIRRSLSIDFRKCSDSQFLSFSPDDNCYLSSLKLHGKLTQVPQFVNKLSDITELSLSSTGLSGENLLVLSSLCQLLYLKLTEVCLEGFDIKPGAFKSLKRLCFVVQETPFPKIEDKALPHLDTFQLLCKALQGLSGINIEYMECLKDVCLDEGITEETREEWEGAAKKHPNRPNVIFIQSAKRADSESFENSCDLASLVIDSKSQERQMESGQTIMRNILNTFGQISPDPRCSTQVAASSS